MNGQNNQQIVQSLQSKWNRKLLFAYVLLALSIAALLLLFVLMFVPFSMWWLAAVALIFSPAIFIFRKQKITRQDVVIFLNQSNQSFEESAHLLLKSSNELTLLEKLQLAKIQQQIHEKITMPVIIQKKIKGFAILLAAILLLTLTFSLVRSGSNVFTHQNGVDKSIHSSTKPETKLPQVKDVLVVISPPFYTRKPTRQQGKFNIIAEQKAAVNWTIATTQKANDVHLLLNDRSVLPLKATNKEQTKWQATKQVVASGFYQLVIDGNASQLYTIEMIPDEPPALIVTSPSPNTFIKSGEQKSVKIAVLISDDYGIDSAYLTATIASGSGEAVTFKQLVIPFANFVSGTKNNNLQKLLNLTALGMGDGDELYFYVAAKDNNNQQKRSDVYIIRLEDSAQLMSLSGMANGLDIKPELFRSERQIIIETEQLLKDKDTLSESKFKEQSNRLGTDQQLLRLRYGKYLGEETQSEIDPSANNSNDLSDYGNAAKVIDEYSDKHDAAEDADFFDAPTKKQLQLMLTEMWKASLQLKTYKPKDALPFEYNALRLLKDLQQKTRAYVAKTGTQTAPLQLEKRLSGELDKIIQPSVQENRKIADSSIIILRRALGILEKISSGETPEANDKKQLKDALAQLNNKAVAEPATYLAAYQSLQKIIGNHYHQNDITLAGKAFQKMIQTFSYHPQPADMSPDMSLSHHYFMNLTQRHD